MSLSIEEMATFCKRKGFVFQTSEIYGGVAGLFDYGPLGVEVKNNIKKQWWRHFVHRRDDIVGIDGSILSHPKVWHASGHVDCFEDVMVEDTKTNERFRADHLIEDQLKVQTDGMSADDMWNVIQEKKVTSPKGNPLSQPKQFNLMFHTTMGPVEDEKFRTHLRPETAQHIFSNFKTVSETQRLALPYGIAQIGKAFRNEISPRDFLFRTREFEQMEVEYFIRPDQNKECSEFDSIKDVEVNYLSAKDQEDNKKHTKITFGDIVKSKRLGKRHAYWLAYSHQFFTDLGISQKNLRIREHLKKELSHYSTATFDIEYNFPHGWKEIHGNAHRGNFDLTQHAEHSKQKLEVYDEETKQKVLPEVIEPSFGVDRAFLACMFEAYVYDEDRQNIVLNLNPTIAPTQVAVLPLVGNKEPVVKLAQEIHQQLSEDFLSSYDKSASVGRRYARNDEIGTPFCVTIDFESVDNHDCTIRRRDDAAQIRVPLKDLQDTLKKLLKNQIDFKKAGTAISQ